jgi:hypothetical protein
MNTYAIYDPITFLVLGITILDTAPANSILLSSNDLTNIQSSGGTTGWTVQSGVLTWPTAASTLLAAQTSQIALLRISCTQAIFTGFTTVVNGLPYTITMREDNVNHDQTNILGIMISANYILSTAKLWNASQIVNPNIYCTDGNGNYYITFAGGTTGTTEPTWPTQFGVAVTDNTVTWYKMGFRISTLQGRIFSDPLTSINIGQQFLLYKNQMQAQYDALSDQIMQATTEADVQAITWPTPV